MFHNYLKIAFRNILRNKTFSFINILGLSIGMACSILIVLWVQHELSYDKFHKRLENIYRITSQLSEVDINAAVTSAPLGPALQSQIAEIKSTMRIYANNSNLLQVNDKIFEEKRIFYVDLNFFEFFSFHLKKGDVNSALSQPEGIVVTEAMVKKYFGEEEALGKVIRINHKDDLIVTGILANVPGNSHLQFDFLQPMSFLARTNDDFKDNVWNNFRYYTYIELNKHFTPTRSALLNLQHKFKEIYKANEPNLKVDFQLQPIRKIHLHSNFVADLPGRGSIQYIYIFIAIGIFILAVACINFMNLATARYARRAKEVGLRKVAGAVRSQIIRQFLAESTMIASLSLFLALIMVMVMLSPFNDLSGKNLNISFHSPEIVLWILVITLFTGLLSGSYPALFLSGFAPINALKGNLKTGAAGSLFRNTMVVVQFVVSITLLVGTVVIHDQLQYIRSINLGYDKENLMYVPLTGELLDKHQTLRISLEQNVLTSNYSFVSDLPTNITHAIIDIEWEGKGPNSQPLFYHMAIDENFMNVFHVTLLKGRTFSKAFPADTVNVVMNEKALNTMNMDVATAVGKSVVLWGTKRTIIGVVNDFNFKPIQQQIEPLILRPHLRGGLTVLRTKPNQTEATIKEVEHIFRTLNPSYPFSYNFIDQDLEKMYKAEYRVSTVFTFFAGLAIFISCLGLYGLSAFLAERRSKEIGVRKVLGSSVLQVVYLLSKNFTIPILVAMLIATPLSWLAMNQWLDGFAYHIEMHWSIFLVAFIFSLLIGWLTVSYESIKAAIANPVKSLREK